MGMTSDAPHTADSNSVGHLELAVPQVSPAGPDDERKVVGYAKMLPVVHTHADQQLSRCVRLMRTAEVVVLEQPPDRGLSVGRRNVLRGCYRKQSVHVVTSLVLNVRLLC